MLKNYLKIALRNFKRHKLYTFISITGLSVGLACALLLILFVQNEWTQNTFHAHAEDLYRVDVLRQLTDGTVQRWADSPIPLGAALANTIPEISQITRYHFDISVVKQGEKAEYDALYFVDPAFFEMFSFPMIAGQAASLAQPQTLLLTASAAEGFFGEQDPLGQTLSVKLGDTFYDFLVGGVLADPPSHSSIQFSLLLPMRHLADTQPGAGLLENWRTQSTTFVRLRPDASSQEVTAKLAAWATAQQALFSNPDEVISLALQPLKAMYFEQDIRTRGGFARGDAAYTRMLIAIAGVILLLAATNFIALSVAQSTHRLKEVGVRKVFGAERGRLMRQFWGEALLMSLVALYGGLALAEVFLPTFNYLVERQLVLDYFARPTMLVWMLGLVVLVGLLAGSYPAFYLSRQRPASVLQQRTAKTGRVGLIRVLVLGQFALSIVLMLSALVITRQLDYMTDYPVGMATDEVIVVRPDFTDQATTTRLENVLQTTPQAAIATVARSYQMMPYSYSLGRVRIAGETVRINQFWTAPSLFEALNIEVVNGQTFATGNTAGVVLNETFVQQLGLTPATAVGQHVDLEGSGGQTQPLEIIGVVRDFHFRSLRSEMQPLMFRYLAPDARGGYVLVKAVAGQTGEALTHLQNQWRTLAPNVPFQYFFLEEALAGQYEGVQRWGATVRYATFFALLIACLGLFGLSSLSVTRRTKEIGIRKVIGASVPSILVLLSRETLVLVLIGLALAAPVGYLLLDQWLQAFAYRINVEWLHIAGVGGATLLLAWATIAYEIIRAAQTPPVQALRYE